MGSWIIYGLGTENQNLPGFVTISPPVFNGGPQNYGSAFLPAVFQGTPIGRENTPLSEAQIRHIKNAQWSADTQRRQLDFLQQINRKHLEKAAHDSQLEGVIESYELAFRMQTAAPRLTDISDETEATLNLYGIGQEPTDNFGRQCLLARRFAQAGVRFIQVNHAFKWDQHVNLKSDHERNSREVDKPIAALLKDLKSCGMLEDTLVLWGGEFGRTPTAQGNNDGRDHNPGGFSVWLAGGGVKGGSAYGATDDYGFRAVENKVHMHDLHATLLHLLGMDHTRLTYRYGGRDFRLTDVHGNVVTGILG
jgi:membrane-anchored protein YejM (alkaline phosphatase superfamily)